MVNLNLTHGGNELPENLTQHFINIAENKLNCKPSFLITLPYYESFWGKSNVGQLNNNWGGMTWNESWIAPFKRDSGVLVTKGTPRPSIEGKNYIKYDNAEDFITDWSYLFRLGGVYKVGNSSTFTESVKGMFRYGGAKYDYATMGLPNNQSKNRFNAYHSTMLSIRNSINNGNNNVLDIIDNEDYSTDEKVDIGNSDFPHITDKLDNVFDDLINNFNDFENNIYNVIVGMFSPFLYDYVNSGKKGNNLITMDKVYNNVYKISMTVNVSDVFKNIDKGIFDNVQRDKEKKDKIEKDSDDARPVINPSTNNNPFFPSSQPYRITDTYRFRREHPVTGDAVWHNGIDIAGMTPGKSEPIYATQNGIVSYMHNSSSGGAGYYMAIEHTSDPYHSVYMHMASAPIPSLGDTIKKGEKIGMSGATGGVSGVHLHFGISTVRNVFNDHNVTIDPEKYLKMKF